MKTMNIQVHELLIQGTGTQTATSAAICSEILTGLKSSSLRT